SFLKENNLSLVFSTLNTYLTILSMLPCLFFLYVNSIMVFALLRKPLLLETPRYILFAHLLFTESIQLMLTMLLYIFAVTTVQIIGYVCIAVTQFAAITIRMSPLNLAAMSLERYIVISFPLRHTTISTPRMAGVAILVIWTVASLDTFIQIFMFVSLKSNSYSSQGICKRNSVFQLHVFVIIDRAFTVVNFVLVTTIVLYTYIAVMITAMTSLERSINKAHKTLLLHLFQLCLCLVSTTFDMIDSSELLTLDRAMAIDVQFVLFLSLIIFPKCLSPLIYGLRDHNLKHSFKYHFTFGCISTVTPYPG
uniref:Odorant receptor, family 93, subfamily A, member 8 n=1 Tax=Oryzias sinensis TaxID=183150 RepID=A0A8C7WXI4_9TELE